MKIAIVGAGAMGGMLAAKLAQSGNNVILVDVSSILVEHINEHGLVVDTKNVGIKTSRIVATAEPGSCEVQDAVIFFVKAQHTAAAATSAIPLVGPNTTIVSLQNGWGNADVLAETYSAEQIVVGVTYHSATVLALGKVAHTGMGATFIGPYVDGTAIVPAERMGQVLNECGLETTVTPLVKTEIWKKLILNSAALPTSALTGLCAGALGESGPTLDLVDELAKEAVSVARLLGYEIELEDRILQIHTILRNAGKGRASMLQDAEAKRKTEIEVVNGAVVRAAEKLGVPVPLNKAMIALIAGLERSWHQ
ncbi:ketopantoate reductase family protein [Paenibacillus cymbidii]|uniref:ketopantoate reductase family protein n=1 Tax=Paenibacillus cymbidii TaxID=1639034 RepID=UPI0014368AAB|nr:2-dehydropantoate 2-reductase [Paenibacillus cymbidii]